MSRNENFCVSRTWNLKKFILFLRTSHKFHPCQDCCNYDVLQCERGPILSLQNSRNSLVTRPLNMWYPPHHESCWLWGNLPATTFFRKIIRPLSAADGDGVMRKCLFCFLFFDQVTMSTGSIQGVPKKLLTEFQDRCWETRLLTKVVPSGPNWPKRSKITWRTKSGAKI